MTPDRRRQLVAFLASLGIDPRRQGGPGDAAAVLAPIEEALTHTSARQRCNHERLEFLGDAVLRLAASEYLHRHHPQLSVGSQSALRSQLVSDRWLAELADSCGLETVWRIGPMARGDRAGLATVRAELCEALIGAIYRCWGDSLEPVHAWLNPHWQLASQEMLADPDRHNWKSALQEWTQGQGLGLPSYSCEERSTRHADPRRFHCRLTLAAGEAQSWEGWGRSRRAAEQDAARLALAWVRSARGS
ncbi:ribonuclease III family protein [Cyanobium sp. NIES-981]|uniref:ribonuclease III family protein n=1 Tax=Cyanobium sp. NIES-981 TaxID=1851505 RepID=UPI0007DE1EF3|nr:ribonuclease III domain-containing protein [Cyanobium sp. NIES-981]SBO43964.1 Ribonuclease 3 [Cyanobium sp. NIES-981]